MDFEFELVCPSCRGPLEFTEAGAKSCPADGLRFERVEGIWRFLLPERATALSQFITDYEAIRKSEERGSDDPAYYRALPFKDVTGRRPAEWRIRAQSFRVLLKTVVGPMHRAKGRPLRALDLGSGPGWLSYQLACHGHHVAAVDLSLDERDGLGACVHYDRPFMPVQAEFDRLPLANRQADLAIFNASLHYSTDYVKTLRQVLRVIDSDGLVIIVDTPFYHNGRSGETMVRERSAEFRRRYGVASDSLDMENFLTYDRLKSLAGTLDLAAHLHWPVPRWRWAIRRWRARIRGDREPAQFPLVALQKHRIE